MENIEAVISQVNSIKVLKFIYNNPGCNQQDIIGRSGKNSKLSRISEFIKYGLIEEKTILTGRTEKQYFLTPEGERIIKGWLLIESGEFGERTDHSTSSGARHKIKG